MHLLCLLHLQILEKAKFLLHLYWLQLFYRSASIWRHCSSKQYFKYSTYRWWYSWCNNCIWVKCESEIWTLQIVMISGNVKWMRGVDMRKVIILLLCLLLVSCGTTNKSKSTTEHTLENSFFGVKKKVKEKLIYKKDKSIFEYP